MTPSARTATTKHLLWGAAALGLFATALLGCPTVAPAPTDGGEAPPECERRADCEGGLVCSDTQRCVDCESPGQCLLRETCSLETKKCVFRDGWGSACTTNDQCQAGEWCMQGLCRDRSVVNLCPGGLSTECPDGFRCNTITSVCEEDLGCAENADCAGNEVCNKGLHACVPRCSVETQSTICSGAERCVNEMCVQCAGDADCGPGLVCDAAGRCSSGNRCYTNQDCKIPLVCYVPTGACLDKPPPCVSDDNCAKTQRCEVSTGRCITRACQPDAYEPNNELSKAYGAQGNREYTALTLCSNDVDFYSLPLRRGDQLGVNVNADPFAEQTFTTLIEDGTGRVVGSGKLLASFVAPAQATYYVAISTTDQFQKYTVHLLLSRGTPCDDDLFEPNDTAATATVVNSASQLEGRVCPQDSDNFRLTVPAGKGARVSLINYSSSAGLLTLCLFDGAVQLGCSDDPTLPLVDIPSAQAAGKTLNARVFAADSRIQNAYTFKAEYP